MAHQVHNKLVRDRIPEKIQSKGDVCETKILTLEECVAELRKKIVEEATELSETTDREQLLFEYADLMVVLDAYMEAMEFSPADIKDALTRNIEDKGHFKDRVFLISTDSHDESS